MKKKLTCIECPKGGVLSVDTKGPRVIKVSGANCPKGEKYAIAEIENPVRVLTSTVLAEGLPLKMIPVRTDLPIPKAYIPEAMEEIKKIKIKRPLSAGDIIARNLLGLKANLIATRECL